mmetsp:Transcript_58420/g.137661  ORF Transcript_58420/g.137661 Transcript_58420/m.137661 type:complete len:276 (+) Transcript_58420:2-829(+)
MNVPTRDLQGAREAFEEAQKSPDLAREASKSAHQMGAPSEAGHLHHNQFLKHLLQGGTAGSFLVGCFLAAMHGARVDPRHLRQIMGSLVGGAAVALGGHRYYRARSYLEFYHRERQREEWETENYLEGEVAEMIELYSSRGLSAEEASTVVQIMSRNPRFFVDVMMLEELGLAPGDAEGSPLVQGFAKATGVALFGGLVSLPVLISPSRADLVPSFERFAATAALSVTVPTAIVGWEANEALLLQHLPHRLARLACVASATALATIAIAWSLKNE